MRRLLALPALVLAAAPFAPAAHASFTCTPAAAGAGVCVQVLDCAPLCRPNPVVDPYCTHDPRILACDVVDRFYITVPPTS